MLTSIFGWIRIAVVGVLQLVLYIVLNQLDMSLSSYLTAFPILGTVYPLLKTVSIGLMVLIAVASLYKFFFSGADSRLQDKPSSVCIRFVVAYVCVQWGGYVLQEIVSLSSISYGMFRELGTGMTLETFGGIFSSDAAQESFGEKAEALISSFLANESLILTFFSLLLVIIIAWNVFKLITEVVERYLMVGVLVFTSPLAYCTIVSTLTFQIFKRWVQMFISANLQMSLSVIFLKLIISGLGSISIGQNYFIQMLLVLAMCKIGQRTDTYLQQLGLTTAITGGNMLDDVLAAASSIGKVFGGAGGKSIGDGKAPASGLLGGRVQGVLGGIASGIRSGAAAYAGGATVAQAGAEGKKAFLNSFEKSTLGGAVKGARSAMQQNKDAGITGKAANGNIAAGAINGAKEGFARKMAYAVAPNTMMAREAEAQLAREEMMERNTAFGQQEKARKEHPAGVPMPMDVANKADALRMNMDGEKPFTNAQKLDNYAQYGIAEKGQSVFDRDGELGIRATAAGVESSYGNLDEAALKNGAMPDRSGPDGTYGRFITTPNEDIQKELLQNAYAHSDIAGEPVLDTDDGYRNKAIQSLSMDTAYGRQEEFVRDLAAAQEADSKNAASGDGENQEPVQSAMDQFYSKYGDDIAVRAAEFQNMDRTAPDELNADVQKVLTNTAATSNPRACVAALFDNDQLMYGNDQLGNAMLNNGFRTISDMKQEGTAFTNIVAGPQDSIRDADGSVYGGGDRLTADFTAKDGRSAHLEMLSEQAYETPYAVQFKNQYAEYTACDGRTLYVRVCYDEPNPNADAAGGRNGSGFVDERVITTSRLRRNTGTKPQFRTKNRK